MNNVMYVIENPLRFAPGPEASAQDRDDFEEERNHSILVKEMILAALVPHLEERLKHFNAYEMYFVNNFVLPVTNEDDSF